MAEISPFRGVRYNPERFPSLDVVVSQPYDRVRYGLQDKYYDLSPYNIVRIIKNKQEEGDDENNNVYTRARDNYHRWLGEGILVREAQPALYVYHQEFTVNGEQRVRKAFIAALKLVDFDEGTVLPHERTHAGPKVDRLNLLRATAANFGQIFMLYPDRENAINATGKTRSTLCWMRLSPAASQTWTWWSFTRKTCARKCGWSPIRK